MRDILFDEKIAGSFHLTPGNAYDEADNGNRSKIHWDLVQIQRPDYGGGTIAFDGVPIRVDGRFVPEELQALEHAPLHQRRASCFWVLEAHSLNAPGMALLALDASRLDLRMPHGPLPVPHRPWAQVFPHP